MILVKDLVTQQLCEGPNVSCLIAICGGSSFSVLAKETSCTMALEDWLS